LKKRRVRIVLAKNNRRATMKRLLAFVPGVVLVLAGCGDTCSSNAAKATTTNPTCSLAPGATATISVAVCGGCNDSSASCQAEFVGGALEVAPVVQQCQGDAGCAISGCTDLTATCSVAVPASLSGSVDLRVVGESTVTGTLSAGTGSTCAL
jgi:hypothetical protein